MIMKRYRDKMLLGIAAGFLLVSCLGLTSIASAEDVGFAGQSGEFLRYGINVRLLGMGGASVGMAGDVTSLFYNPAGLTRLPREYQAYAMHSTLYGESRYNVLACNFSTGSPISNMYPLVWGIGIIDHGSDNYERRSETDDHLGFFGVKEQAAMLGVASEIVKPFGIFSYGVTGKFIRQEIDDISANGVGFDVGVQLQILNPSRHAFPAIRAIAPLRFGVSWQNLIRPSVKLIGTSDTYPGRLRFGVGGEYKVADSMRIVVASDIERLSHANDCRTWRWYGGVEMQKEFPSVIVAPRIGYNNLDKRVSLGAGITAKLPSVDARFDFAWSGHEYLADDYRLAVTLDFGSLLGRKKFHKRAGTYHENKDSSMARMNYLQVISRYDGEVDSCIEAAGEMLAVYYDKVNANRYYDLIGGLGKANRDFYRARNLRQKDDPGSIPDIDRLVEAALQEYSEAETERRRSFLDRDWMNYAETHMFVNHWDWALLALGNVEDSGSLRYNYLFGVCHQKLGNWSIAAEYFKKNIGLEDTTSMASLSLLNYGRALVEMYSDTLRPQMQNVVDKLEKLVRGLRVSLTIDYPRYDRFPDGDLVDDMLLILGRCYKYLGDFIHARLAYNKICLLYDNSDSYESAEKRVLEIDNVKSPTED